MIEVIRLNHRAGRDKRMTTHCALTSRALGADKMTYSGDKDQAIEENIAKVTERWGGNFNIEYKKNWKSYLKQSERKKIYLSMYGIPIQERIDAIRKVRNNILIIVGGKKVPGDIYNHIDEQIAVTNQPHSEVAALSIFLHELQQGKELEKKFDDSKIRINPREKGKDILESE